MKKYIKYLVFLILLPSIIYAYKPKYCTEEEYKQEFNKVQAINAVPMLIESNKEYSEYVIAFNITKDQIKKNNQTDPDNYMENATKISYITKYSYGTNVKLTDINSYRIYGKDSTKEKVTITYELRPNNKCYPEKLKSLDFYLLYVNPYAKSEKCKNYPNFKYCKKNIYVDKDDKELEKLFDEYIKAKEEKKVITNRNNKNKFIKLLLKIGISIFVVLLIVLLIIKIIRNRKIKKIYYIFLLTIFIPVILHAAPPKGTKNQCSQKHQNAELYKWCKCMDGVVKAVNRNKTSLESCDQFACIECIGKCTGVSKAPNAHRFPKFVVSYPAKLSRIDSRCGRWF